MSIEDIKQVRLNKLEEIKKAGKNPYPAVTNRTHTLKEVEENFNKLLDDKATITVAGRIMSMRGQGAIIFSDIFDGTARFQTLFKADEMKKEDFDFYKDVVDIGDFVEATGNLFVTKSGQNTLQVSSWRILSKSILPLPEKWHGIQDETERLRKRYLDILTSDDLADRFRKRSKFWNVIRQFLLEKDFIEVETPVLENTTGGADARPFETHHNALDMDVYLRISAGELWQKRLMVAGLPRTFEIGRIFRNEGMSNEHAQDYTQLEYYMAYGDYREGMEMTKELYRRIANEVFGKTKFSIRGFEVDLDADWQIYDFCKLIKEKFNIDPLDPNLKDEYLLSVLKKEDIKFDPKEFNKTRGVDSLWKVIRKSLGGPGFLIGVPVYLEPLAKRSAEDDRIVERFQVILAGSEMGKGFSELNDPIDQRERFEEQQSMRDAGDEEAQMADFDYVEALEHGMPGTFGFGVSERLFSFLLDIPIREAQLFPLLKPENPKTTKTKDKEVAVIVLDNSADMLPWQKMNTVAHLSSSFSARFGKKLFFKEKIETKDSRDIKLNIQHAIMIKEARGQSDIKDLMDSAKDNKIDFYGFTREMIETTSDKKVEENTKNKNYADIEFLGVLVFGPRTKVEELTKDFSLFK